ncbi:MAG: VWA domain-containing protein [Propionibacteriaceae bacterium]|jgi:Ca-activated chloride channel family protein|nr:VWA domain-containing protein [Propionibacteriaceae bacterium]
MALIPLIGFLRPERLWCLLLVPAVLLLYAGLLFWRRNRAARPRTILERVIPRQQGWKRHVAVLLGVLSLISLTVAFAQPKDEVLVPKNRATIVVTIDVSRSMEAVDVPPDRLSAAKEAAKDFVAVLPSGFNVALVRFAATAAVVVPPTTDHALVNAQIDRLAVSPATATGEAIYASLDAVQQAPPDPAHPDDVAPAAIVLLSDGARNSGRPYEDAAEEAKQMGVPIYTICFGTDDGYVTENGSRSSVPPAPDQMRDIAEISGGKMFEAASLDELHEVYDNIAESVGYETADVEVTEAYAGGALAFAILAALAAISLAARWP